MHVEAPTTLPPPNDAWSFVRWLLGTVAVLLAVIAGFNAWADPTGELGTGRIDPMAELPRDRAAKTVLLAEAEDPDVVVLGSSRSKRIDFNQPGGVHAVNAAVVGSDLLEARVFARWLEQRAQRDAAFPHLVIGIDIEQFRGSSLRSTGMLGVPQLEAVARAEGGSVEHLPAEQLGDLLLSWQATRESIASVRSRAKEASLAAAAARNRDSVTLTRSADDFQPDGILRSDSQLDTAAGRDRVTRALPTEMRIALHDYRERYDSIGDDLDAGAVADFRALVRAAHDEGDVPTVFLTPMHPALARALDRDGRAARHAKVSQLLRTAAARGEIEFIDCAACLSGAARFWTDGVHPSPLGARELTKRLRSHLSFHGNTRHAQTR